MTTKRLNTLHSATPLIKAGRFSDALRILQPITPESTLQSHDLQIEALIADMLQRIGQNDKAASLAERNLPLVTRQPALAAHYHFVLGNICKEKGESAKAVEHLQIGLNLARSNPELSGWLQLRLLSTIADMAGTRTALLRLEQVRRHLTQLGNTSLLSALYLWLVEVECTRGNLASAHRHFESAAAALAQDDNVWLKGYAAINGSVLHYYSAELAEARKLAETAIQYSEISGHRTTRRAAYANLGYIEFSAGALSKAHNYYQKALECCDSGSASEILILDNIAEIYLHHGDNEQCKAMLDKIEKIGGAEHLLKQRQFSTWATHTKIRLLLKEGRAEEAKRFSAAMLSNSSEFQYSRMDMESRLLEVEALLANDELQAATEKLSFAISGSGQLSPDLLAECERVHGRLLAAANYTGSARLHLNRAADTFELIGHALGRDRSLEQLRSLATSQLTNEDLAAQHAFDRIRALIETRSKPEVFGWEALLLLQDLQCTESAELSYNEGARRCVLREIGNRETHLEHPIVETISLGRIGARHIELSYRAKRDVRSQMLAVGFRRLIDQILHIAPAEPELDDHTIMWASADTLTDGREVVFASDAMGEVLRMIKQVARTDVSILLLGETGVGKEVVAKTIHEYSARAAKPFLAYNCATVSRDLLESQLFGHKRGAFSGATDNFLGIVRAADGGTLLLDEIGEIPFELQAKLLRFLEESEVHPVGETKPTKVDVRLIFATNSDLQEAVSQNRFRQDLFYRINVVPLRLPPLRERREEIPFLINLFSQRFAREFGKKPIQVPPRTMELLSIYSWPGNVRELANEIRRLTALANSGALVTPEQLSPQIQGRGVVAADGGTGQEPTLTVRMDQALDHATATIESAMIKRALQLAKGNLETAASMLGISRKGLYLKRVRLGLLDYRGR